MSYFRSFSALAPVDRHSPFVSLPAANRLASLEVGHEDLSVVLDGLRPV